LGALHRAKGGKVETIKGFGKIRQARLRKAGYKGKGVTKKRQTGKKARRKGRVRRKRGRKGPSNPMRM